MTDYQNSAGTTVSRGNKLAWIMDGLQFTEAEANTLLDLVDGFEVCAECGCLVAKWYRPNEQHGNHPDGQHTLSGYRSKPKSEW